MACRWSRSTLRRPWKVLLTATKFSRCSVDILSMSCKIGIFPSGRLHAGPKFLNHHPSGSPPSSTFSAQNRPGQLPLHKDAAIASTTETQCLRLSNAF